MFSISPIIFIKRRNRYQIKNNIRYNGSINNTSVINFLTQKLPAMVLCLGEPPRRFLLLLYLHFIFISFLIFICRCSSFCRCIFHSHFICFSTSSLTLPWTITGFLQPFYTLSPAHLRVIHKHFHISTILIASYHENYDFEWAFFALRSFTGIFYSTCIYQDFPGSRQFFLEASRGFIPVILETQTRPTCLFDS